MAATEGTVSHSWMMMDSLVVEQRHVVLDHGVAGGGVDRVSVEFSDALSHPERPPAADHGELPVRVHHRVPREQAEGAAVVRPRGEAVVGR